MLSENGTLFQGRLASFNKLGKKDEKQPRMQLEKTLLIDTKGA